MGSLYPDNLTSTYITLVPKHTFIFLAHTHKSVLGFRENMKIIDYERISSSVDNLGRTWIVKQTVVD